MCKVSVLMPVYNAEKYLAEAIDSIICQTFVDWELLIINDGSTDSSKSIIETYPDTRIRYVENEKNLGLIETLNKGIQLCRGEYIARMDSDDIATPDRLEKQALFMDKHLEYVMCGSNATVIDDNGKITGRIINPSSNVLLQISLLFTNPFVHPSMMVRKEVLENDSFDSKWLHIEDFELWTRLASKGKIANLEESLLKYRWHNSNISTKYADIQEQSKNEIIKHQLEKLNIQASDKDLELHRLTFRLYSLGCKKSKLPPSRYKDVSRWFARLRRQNRKMKYFPQEDFEAYLWSRWIVLCISQREILRMGFIHNFASHTIPVVFKMLKLIAYLIKK